MLKKAFLSLAIAAAISVIPIYTQRPVAAKAANALHARYDNANVIVSVKPEFNHAGTTIPKSFLGISLEYSSIPKLFARPALAITSRLLNRLTRLQGPPVVRIGGNSEDCAVWHLPALLPKPAGDWINLTNRTAMMLHAAAVQTNSQLILGVNFGHGTPALAKPWIQSAIKHIGASHILAFEIGNEPDLYNHNGARPHTYNLGNYLRQWKAFAKALQPQLPSHRMLAGPAFCAGWRKYTPEFIKQEHRRLAVVTMHEYPLGTPIENRRSPRYADIANLLKSSSSTVFAQLIRSSVAAGRRDNIPVRFAEINSAYGGGKAGVSNAFAASLWSLDTMFEVASTGSAGVNFHTGPRYGAFWSFHPNTVRVLPLYYGMLMFAQAAPPGSRLIPMRFHTPANINIWMTLDQHRMARIVLINKDLHRNVTIQLKLPGNSHGTLERLSAPSITSRHHITIGGLTFNGSRNGRPTGEQHLVRGSAKGSIYTIALHHGSAALLAVQLNH